jgi:hypothetical protein
MSATAGKPGPGGKVDGPKIKPAVAGEFFPLSAGASYEPAFWQSTIKAFQSLMCAARESMPGRHL